MKVKPQTEEEVMSFFQNTHKTFYAWFSSALIVVIVALSANVRAADVCEVSINHYLRSTTSYAGTSRACPHVDIHTASVPGRD